MKVKVLKSKKTSFPSYWTPVRILVKGEEDKGEQERGLKVLFAPLAEKKLPINFKGGIIEVKGEEINYPFIYEIKQNDKGEDDYPFVYIKDIVNVEPLKPMKNTCTFLGVEDETEETEIVNESVDEQSEPQNEDPDKLPF